MKKFLSSSQALMTLPILFFIFLIISIILIWSFPKYSTSINVIDINQSNTVAITEPNFGIKSTIQKTNPTSGSGFKCDIINIDFEPTCRLEIWLTDSKTKGMDFSHYQSMQIVGTYQTPTDYDFLRISLRNYEHLISETDVDQNYKFNLIEILSSDVTNPIIVNLNRLTVPNWWLATVRDQNITREVDLRNTAMIELSTGLHATPGKYELHVASIQLEKQNISIEQLYEYFFIFWSGFIIFSIIKVTIYLWLRIKQKTETEQNLLDINQSLSKHSKQLELINKTDELTMVLNRIGMKDKLMESLNNNWFPMAVVMLDIDHFKQINDTFGHQCGDNVLIELGKTLNKFTKHAESVCRFGGEEFIILLPKNKISKLKGRLEQLRLDIQNQDMGIGQSVTVSIGAAYCDERSGFNALLEQSDNALYQAKAQGRNAVIFYNHPQMEPTI